MASMDRRSSVRRRRASPAYAVSVSQTQQRGKATADRPVEVRLELSYDDRRKVAAVVTVLVTVKRQASRKKKSIKKTRSPCIKRAHLNGGPSFLLIVRQARATITHIYTKKRRFIPSLYETLFLTYTRYFLSSP